MHRVVIHVDGFNLFFRLQYARMKLFYWQDLTRLGEAMILPDQSIRGVRYFTARIRDDGSNSPDRRRQSTYIDALNTLPCVSVHEGYFQKQSKTCRSYGANWTTYWENVRRQHRSGAAHRCSGRRIRHRHCHIGRQRPLHSDSASSLTLPRKADHRRIPSTAHFCSVEKNNNQRLQHKSRQAAQVAAA